ncbi:hypothetical protein U9M48_040090 [Paspalum notatum var. saurae]|uniref:Sister chromatid cohesion 1 protein 3 n=1 Tax=Paspalum notatum var. saurae TaxID=547442 RepID=A0AAQ3UPS8_PASNO
MFYSHTILARKRPLGTVWIAAHLERKIKKPQIDGIDIPSYAESIMFPEVPIALRLSGHLLLGLVRIYSWKVNYLFHDCNKMVATIRTSFTSVEVNLPVEVEPAPFDSITLPPTLNLDDLNLDDVISQINTPDNHQTTLDQITLAEEVEYVMIDLDEDDRVEPLAPGLLPYIGPEPLEAEYALLQAICQKILTLKIHLMEDKICQKKMREAPQEGPDHFTDSILGNDDPMAVEQNSPPFVQNKIITPLAVDETSSAGEQLAGRSIPIRTPNDLIDDVGPVNSGRYMKKLTNGDGLNKLVCKRKKLPQTALDKWKFRRTGSKGSSFFLEPLVQGMCTNLLVTCERNFSRVGDPDAESPSSKPMADEANVGSQDALPERQLNPTSHGNENALPVGEVTQKSQGNADTQPEPQPTPTSPGGAGSARDEDMLPEFPRFSPVHMPSPIREDDSPFINVSQTPHSGFGGTGITEMTPSVRNYSLPGQNTPNTDHMVFMFLVDDDYDDQPEAQGLISTPGCISNAGTGTTGLGSMSARTRAVALFFKDHAPSTPSEEQPGKISLSRILEGKLRKQAARLFFETMVLKSYNCIDVQQEEPYGDIDISVRPSLTEAKL